MQTIMAIIVVLTLAITIGLGFLQNSLGKKQKDNRTGMIAPIAYLIIRILLVLFTSNQDEQIITSIFGTLIIAGIYWWIFVAARKRATK